MALGDLMVQVKVNADELSAGLSKIDQRFKETSKNIQAAWGNTDKAGQEAMAKLEQRARNKVISRAFDASANDIVRSWKRTEEGAKASLAGIERMIGIQLPASVDKFLSKSQTIAPALSAAFKGIVILEAIRLLEQLPALFAKISAAITGWDETAKKAYDNFLTKNRQAVDAAEDFRLKMLEIDFGPIIAGEAGRAKAIEDAVAAQKAAVAAQEELNKQQEKINQLRSFGLAAADVSAAERERVSKLFEFAEAQAKKITHFDKQLATLRKEQAKKDTEEWLEIQKRALEKFRDLVDKALNQPLLPKLPTFLMPPAPGIQVAPPQPVGFFGADVDAELKRLQDAIDKGKAISQAGAEAMGEGRIQASRRADEQILRDQELLFSRIQDSAGAVFDAIFAKGQSVFESLGKLMQGFFATLGRTLFQDIVGLGANALFGLKGPGGGGLLAKLPGVAGLLGLGGGGVSGAGTAGIPLASAGLGVSAGAVAATGGLAAAAIGGIAWAKSQAHHEANTFVREFQNPFHRSLELITGSAKTASEKLTSIDALWAQFEANSQAFAQAGSDEAKVVQQAFESLQPLVDRIRSDLRGIEGAGGPATIMLQLDKRTVARLIIPDLYALTRNEGMQLQPTPTR